MSNTDLNILLVDDDPVLIAIHSAFLQKNGHTVVTAEDGSQAMKIITDNPEAVGVVVSDVSMPVMDGYELCRQLKKNDETRDIPVVFVSALNDLDEKLKGYGVGADDYITKPVEEPELLEKVKSLLELRTRYKALRQQASESQSVAMQAMTFSSELGQMVEFYKNMLTTTDHEELANCVFRYMEQDHLRVILQIQTPVSTLNFSNTGAVTPLEANVIEMAGKDDRFFDFGTRTIVTYPVFSLLVKNMPVDDADKYGRIKDILGMIGSGLEGKLQQLNNDILAQKKDDILKSLQESLGNIEQAFNEVQKESVASIEDMNEDLRNALMVLGLSEFQEENLENITLNCMKKSNEAFYKGARIQTNLESINDQLQNILGAA